jgi:hypothetical protein
MQKLLTSWKEIAQYAGKGVRTIQRWEVEFGFPIRRAKANGHRSIIAIPEEINTWVRSQTGTRQDELERLRSEVERLQVEVEQLRAELVTYRKQRRSRPYRAKSAAA